MSATEDNLWTALEPYQLFNKLNNFEPLQLLDLRSYPEFYACRVRQSKHDQSQENLHSILDESLSTRIINSEGLKGTRYYVFLLPEETGNKDLLSYMDILNDRVIKVKGIITKEIDIEDTVHALKVQVFVLPFASRFFTMYEKCSFVLERNDEKNTNRLKYYASEIIPGFLYLGDYSNATDEEQLRALEITHVIDATNQNLSEPVCKKLSINYLPVEIWDMETSDIKQHFTMTNEFISQAKTAATSSVAVGGRVFVHCRAGWSRSPSIVLAYLMKYNDLYLIEAAQMAVRERPLICPNESFRQQLIEYERELAEEKGGEYDAKRLCQSGDELRQAILAVSCLWSHSSTTETEIDRIPVGAKLKAFNVPELPEDSTSEQISSKPKKPFLKRGEAKKGKISAQSKLRGVGEEGKEYGSEKDTSK